MPTFQSTSLRPLGCKYARTVAHAEILIRWATALLIASTPALGQSASRRDSTAMFAVGVASGTMSLGGGASANGIAASVTVTPTSWLSLSATPAFQRVAGTATINRPARPALGIPASSVTQSVAASGLGDLPVSMDLRREFDAPWTPTIGGGLGGTLPTGDSASGLGLNHAVAWWTAGGSVSPTAVLTFTGSLGRELLSATRGARPASFVEAGAELWLNDWWGLHVGASSDVAVAASAYAYRSVSVGSTVYLSEQLQLAIEASRGVYGSQTMPGISVGIGTTFASFVPSEGASARGLGASLSGLGRQRNPGAANPRRPKP